MSATKEVGNSIASIQAGTQGSVKSMEEATLSVQKSTELATQAEGALHEIVGFSHATSDQIQAIATASEEQSSTSEHINKETEEISQLTAEAVQILDEAEKAVAGLSELTNNLTNIIEAIKKA
jgi:methyl-accepting chemotaxis protein